MPPHTVLLSFYELFIQKAPSALRQLTEFFPFWFWETDEDYVITYCSENIAHLSGVQAQELHGVCIMNPVYGRGESEAGLAGYLEALRKRELITSYPYERIMLTGEKMVLVDSAVPKFDDDGAFKGYCGVSSNMSVAMQAADKNGSLIAALKSRAEALEEALSERNKELAESNRLLGEVLDALGEGLLVTNKADLTDPGAEIQFVNPAYRSILGLDEHEVYPGMSMIELSEFVIEKEPGLRNVLSEVRRRISDGELAELNLPLHGKSLEIKAIPRPDGGLVIVHNDVTGLRQEMAMREEAARAAEAANLAKSQFLASMSHEIRTPMNGIIGVADLLSHSTLNEEQAEFVETIRNSAAALNDLIADILDYSKIEAGHLSLQEADFNLKQLVRDMSKMLSPMADEKGLKLNFDFNPAQPEWVIGDQQRLRQVLINLVGNAIKFTPAGSVCICVTSEEPGMTRIVVKDTGIGIPEDKLGAIFNSFEQVQSGFQRQFEGSGLGLSISRQLVCAMGGDISVISEIGSGSTFHFDIPMKIAKSPQSNFKSKPIQMQRLDLSQQRILLAEDNLTNQLVAKKMLNRCGAEPSIVSNGQEACRLVEQDPFDIILMDVSMPVMNGLEATVRIRQIEQAESRAPCIIVALTGNAFEADRQRCLAAGMDEFMTKPISFAELVKSLGRATTPKKAS